MNWLLKHIQPNSTRDITASMDLFNRFGVLLLSKGQPITQNIKELLKKREVFVWVNEDDAASNSTQKVKAFPKDVYTELVGSLWGIYHNAKLIQPDQIEKTIVLVETILNELKTQKVFIDFNQIQFDIGKFKQHDYGTFVHSLNVALLTATTGMNLGYEAERLKLLTLGALLHDIGKLSVPIEILNKQSSLTDHEFAVMKQHPKLGVEMLKNSCLEPIVIAIVEEHHERWDVKGYPYGLHGNNIHLDAQIVAVADVYEAITADRPYRKGIPPYHALEMILAWSGKDFNPLVVQAFRESLILYPEDAIVILNTGEIGVVVGVNVQLPTRPLIRVLFDNNGKFLNEEIYFDLNKDFTRFIERVEFKDE